MKPKEYIFLFLRMDKITFGLNHLPHTIQQQPSQGGKSQRPRVLKPDHAPPGCVTSAHLSEPQYPHS